MKPKKTCHPVYLTFMILFAIATVVFVILGCTSLHDIDLFPIFFIFGGAFLVIALAFLFGWYRASKVTKYQLANYENPNSVAHKVMCDNTKFERFVVLPDPDAQGSQFAKDVAFNALGAVSAAVFGFGMFRSTKTVYLEAFVSEDELIINSARNPYYDDAGFARFVASDIVDVSFANNGGQERVTLTLANNMGYYVFDIHDSHTPQQIHDAFGRLAQNRTAATAPVFPEFAPPQEPTPQA